jgi:hypothetical protein
MLPSGMRTVMSTPLKGISPIEDTAFAVVSRMQRVAVPSGVGMQPGAPASANPAEYHSERPYVDALDENTTFTLSV